MNDNGYDKDKLAAELSKLRERVKDSEDNESGVTKSKFLGSASNLTPFIKGARGGFEFIISIVIGGVVGYALDQYFGTLPFLLVLFVIFGFFAGLKNLYSFLTKK